ncbi:MAG: hypothetical protein FWC17_03630 [Treponema sp.]|nr:hypothetical protein [Treponema sp.]
MSFLWIPNYIKVTQFNNRAVDWIAPALAFNPISVGVPPGENTLIIETVVPANNTARIPNVRNKSFTINFESGKGYQLINRNGEIVIVDQSGRALDSIQPTAEVIDVDINSLFAEVRNNSVRARQLYHGQTIRVTGKIQTIDQSGVGIGNSPLQMLVVFLSVAERTKLVNLNSGQEITVRGVFDISDMSLDRGVIE